MLSLELFGLCVQKGLKLVTVRFFGYLFLAYGDITFDRYNIE